jgi:hypothetical protein
VIRSPLRSPLYPRLAQGTRVVLVPVFEWEFVAFDPVGALAIRRGGGTVSRP